MDKQFYFVTCKLDSKLFKLEFYFEFHNFGDSLSVRIAHVMRFYQANEVLNIDKVLEINFVLRPMLKISPKQIIVAMLLLLPFAPAVKKLRRGER